VPGQRCDQGILAAPGHVPFGEQHPRKALDSRPLPIAFGGPGAVTVAGTRQLQARRYRRRRCAATRTVTYQSSCSMT
jgi:hypothetical protein